MDVGVRFELQEGVDSHQLDINSIQGFKCDCDDDCLHNIWHIMVNGLKGRLNQLHAALIFSKFNGDRSSSTDAHKMKVCCGSRRLQGVDAGKACTKMTK